MKFKGHLLDKNTLLVRIKEFENRAMILISLVRKMIEHMAANDLTHC